MAIKKLQGMTQKGDIEEYLTKFKGWANLAGFDDVALVDQFKTVTTRYRLLHYANLIRRTGLICFLFNLLNLAMPLLSYVVRLVLLILVPLSSLPCYLYDTVLILTSDILYSLIDTFLSILRYISTRVFVVEP
jgi:hypothetical protein